MLGGLISGQEGLNLGLGAAEAEAFDGVRTETDLTAHQAALPERLDPKAVGQHAKATLVVGAADEDDGRVSLGILPGRRPRATGWGGVLTILALEVMGGDEAIRAQAQLAE